MILKAPRTTYGMDDGGCYYCNFDADVPFTGTLLSEHCKLMCEADEECVAYTIGRPASLPYQDYYYGERANCCLERRHYPPGAFVSHVADVNAIPKNNRCQLESMCWTRYEKIRSNEQDEDYCGLTPTTPSNLCTPVWPSQTYTDEKIQKKIDFIANGCEYNDAKLESMLVEAHARCWEEKYAESMSFSVISYSSKMHIRASIDTTFWSVQPASSSEVET